MLIGKRYKYEFFYLLLGTYCFITFHSSLNNILYLPCLDNILFNFSNFYLSMPASNNKYCVPGCMTD